MEVKNAVVDAGSLTVFNSDYVNASPDTFDDKLNAATALKYFLILKDELLKSKHAEEAANELKKLAHRFKDFDIGPNEVVLPKTAIEFPRFQKFEMSKTTTKWEKFAKEKGIQKVKKRSRMVWSAEVKDWVPRWGRGSTKHIQEELDVIREVKKNQDPYQDPFAASRNEKKMKIAKQEVREVHNKIRAAGLRPAEFGGPANGAEQTKAKGPKVKKTKDSERQKRGAVSDRKRKIEKKIAHSKTATGTMGKYKGDTDILDKKTKKRVQKTHSEAKNIKDEKRRNSDFLRKALGGK
jgi:regulator of ribosome biosynthesis